MPARILVSAVVIASFIFVNDGHLSLPNDYRSATRDGRGLGFGCGGNGYADVTPSSRLVNRSHVPASRHRTLGVRLFRHFLDRMVLPLGLASQAADQRQILDAPYSVKAPSLLLLRSRRYSPSNRRHSHPRADQSDCSVCDRRSSISCDVSWLRLLLPNDYWSATRGGRGRGCGRG
jgi:hypothetical protein